MTWKIALETSSEPSGCLEIHPCVLQDIGPLGPLPKKLNSELLEKFKVELFKTEFLLGLPFGDAVNSLKFRPPKLPN